MNAVPKDLGSRCWYVDLISKAGAERGTGNGSSTFFI